MKSDKTIKPAFSIWLAYRDAKVTEGDFRQHSKADIALALPDQCSSRKYAGALSAYFGGKIDIGTVSGEGRLRSGDRCYGGAGNQCPELRSD